jgi:hypothetical protein
LQNKAKHGALTRPKFGWEPQRALEKHFEGLLFP